MTNPNVFSALAYIRSTENPLRVISNYICYVMQKLGCQRMAAEDILVAVGEEFGIKLSTYVFDACKRQLIREKRIAINSGALILNDIGFDLERFEQERLNLKEREENLINDLIRFVSDFNVSWSLQEAKAYLGNFLLEDGRAVDLFTTQKIILPKRCDEISPDWFVGKYVEELLNEKNLFFEYLMQIVNGLIIYIGVFEATGSHQQNSQKYHGTLFFLDTKLVLRLLELSTTYAVEATKQMVSLIRDEYKGTIAVFEHTIAEVEAALHNASTCVKNGHVIRDDEMRAFASQSSYSADDFQILVSNVRNKLEDHQVIIVDGNIQWNDKLTQANNMDDNSLVEHITKRHYSWQTQAIRNDVNAINAINIMRKSNYTKSFGGKEHLPIFITSNTALIACVKEYVTTNKQAGNLPNWATNRLPIISDYLLTCQLWLPKAQSHKNFPILTLAHDAQAAQQGNWGFYQKLAEETRSLREKHSLNLVDLDAARREKLEELSIAQVAGKIEQIDADIIAYSHRELVRLETQADKEQIAELESKNKKTETTSKHHEGMAVSAIAKRVWQDWKALRIYSFFARWAYWVLMIIGILIPETILGLIDVTGLWGYMISLALALWFIGDKAIDRYQLDKKIEHYLIETLLTNGKNNIKTYLDEDELAYLDQVYTYLFSYCPQLKWYREKYPNSL